MTDQPTNATSSTRSQDTRAPGTSSAPAANSIIGDPMRRDIGDEPEEVQEPAELPRNDDKSATSGDTRRYTPSASDADEGHKGPSGETAPAKTDVRPQGDATKGGKPVDPATLRTHPNQRMPQSNAPAAGASKEAPAKSAGASDCAS